MAQRVKITVLGATLAPYSSANLTAPIFLNGGLSEDWHVDVSQLQRGVDTSFTQQTTYPLALSSVVIKYVEANHFKTSTVFISVNSATLDVLSNQ